MNRNDMRVLEPRREPDLADEALGPHGLGQLGVEDFERHRSVMPEVVGEVHRGHAPATELALDAVAIGLEPASRRLRELDTT